MKVTISLVRDLLCADDCYLCSLVANVLLQAQMTSIDALLIHSKLRWSLCLVLMQDNRLPKQLFYGELTEGHRPRGRP